MWRGTNISFRMPKVVGKHPDTTTILLSFFHKANVVMNFFTLLLIRHCSHQSYLSNQDVNLKLYERFSCTQSLEDLHQRLNHIFIIFASVFSRKVCVQGPFRFALLVKILSKAESFVSSRI